jgi:hypothetical protein
MASLRSAPNHTGRLSHACQDGSTYGRTQAVLCCAVLCCAVLCCAVLCCAVLCCAVLCCAVLCCVVLCCAVLCCAVLCCAPFFCAMSLRGARACCLQSSWRWLARSTMLQALHTCECGTSCCVTSFPVTPHGFIPRRSEPRNCARELVECLTVTIAPRPSLQI